jgi:hypothetical protein
LFNGFFSMLIAAIGFWSAVVYLVLAEGRVPTASRRVAPRLTLASAIAAFGVAPFVQGEYRADVSLFIGGPNAYDVESIERSYTALAVGLGVVLLALAALARWGARLVGSHPLAQAAALTIVVIALRVTFEKLGVPLSLATFVGIIWLVVPLPVYFAVRAARLGSQRRFWRWSVAYAIGTRLLVVMVMLIATYFELGTHFDNSGVTRFEVFGKVYDVEPHSWGQYGNLILFPQLVLWTGLTLVASVLFGWPSYWIARWHLRRAAGPVGT